jgi:hypothetical protein
MTLFDLRCAKIVCKYARTAQEPKRGRVIPLLAGARVFPEAQPREWAASANSSSEGLGNNSGFHLSDNGLEAPKAKSLFVRVSQEFCLYDGPALSLLRVNALNC